MPTEPEHLIYRFPHRARRWRRIKGYSQVDSRRHRELSTVHYEFKSENPAAAGRKIAFFSDLHFRDLPAQRRRLDELIELILDFSPDYLVAGGDLIGYASDIDCLPQALQRLSGTAPAALAVLGNWESGKIWLPDDYWENFYRENGFRLLENEFFDDGICCFYGAGYLPAGKLAPSAWPDEPRARAFFAHSPDTIICFDSGSRSMLPPLSVCGHTHGGQVRLPLIGALYSSSIYGRRFDYGLFGQENSGRRMIVSSGVENCSFPLRCCCRREIVFITLA